MLGLTISIIVALGLFWQFNYFKNVMREHTQDFSTQYRDIITSEINIKLISKGQVINDAADFISLEQNDEKELLTYLNKLMINNPTFTSIYFGTVDNKMINASGWVPPKNFDLRTRPWYIKALQENKLVFSEAFTNASGDKVIITMAKPVYNSSKKLLGVVAADVPIKEILNIVDNKKFRSEDYSFLLDGKGNILTHPNYKYDVNTEIKNIKDVMPQVDKKILENKNGKFKIVMDSVEGYLAYETIENTDWIIGSFVPLNNHVKMVHQSLRIFMITLLSSFVVFIALFWLQKKYFIIPIFQLDKDVQRISIEENIGYRIPVNPKEPFALLKKSINSVLDKTQQFFYQSEIAKEKLKTSNKEIELALEKMTSMKEELKNQNNELIENQIMLSESLERNKALVNAMPDLLFMVSNEGVFTDCQVSNEKLLSFSKKNFLGKTVWEVVPKEVADLCFEKMQLAFKSNKLETFEFELQVFEGKQNFEVRMVKSKENEIVAILRNITERKKLEQKLYFLSYHDQLTGVHNRRYFEEKLKALDEEMNLPITIVMADVNGLKLINDSFGHNAGDELLQRVAEVIKKGCRPQDEVSRIGGDEFVLLMPQTNDIEAEAIINNIHSMCLKEKVASLDLSISFGWQTKKQKEEDITEVLNKAEDYMYRKIFTAQFQKCNY